MHAQILVVDDDADILDLLAEALEDEGFGVLTASDGQQGVTLAHAATPRVIVMDLVMPVLDGGAAIRRLKDDPDTHDIPIIAVSATLPPPGLTDTIPADVFLAKPFDLQVLTDAVTALLPV